MSSFGKLIVKCVRLCNRLRTLGTQNAEVEALQVSVKILRGSKSDNSVNIQKLVVLFMLRKSL